MLQDLILFEYNFWLLLLLLIIGIAIGTIAIIAGVGGGVMAMPIFLLILHFDPFLAKGTSLFTIFLSSGVALYVHMKNGKIHLLSSIIMAVFAILGSLACTFFQLAIEVDELVFYIIFGVFEIVIGLRLGVKGIKSFKVETGKKAGNEASQKSSPSNVDSITGSDEISSQNNSPINLIKDPPLIWKAVPLFFLAGFAATFFGIGGGVINTPTLYGVFNLPIHYATAGSTSIIFFTAIFNTITYGIQQKINWVIGITMGLGMMVGGRIGAKFASRISRWLTLMIITVLLVITGMRIIIGIL